jgi:hypothetical protein
MDPRMMVFERIQDIMIPHPIMGAISGPHPYIAYYKNCSIHTIIVFCIIQEPEPEHVRPMFSR